MHALLARMRESGVRAVAVEVSAQALTRHRVDGLVFDVAAFTNLSHDHLDDYADMEEYFQAKLALFQPDRAKRGVVSPRFAVRRSASSRSRASPSRRSRPSVTPTVDEAEWTVEILDETATVHRVPTHRTRRAARS